EETKNWSVPGRSETPSGKTSSPGIVYWLGRAALTTARTRARLTAREPNRCATSNRARGFTCMRARTTPLAAALLAVALALVVVAPAGASFPGRNGLIAVAADSD